MTLPQTTEQHKAAVRRLYLDILNTGRLELLDQLVSPNYTGPSGEHGPAGLAATVAPLRAAFPDIRWALSDLVADGDKVVVCWEWTGTHQGAFRGFAASHKVVTNQAIAIYAFRDGKIISAWLQSDRLGFLQQIGAISPEIASGPPASRSN